MKRETGFIITVRVFSLMVSDVVGKAAMLQHAGHHMVPGAIEARCAYQKHAAASSASSRPRRNGGGIDQNP